MNTDDVIRFLGWGLLTYMWLDTNRLFFCAIVNAINDHNEQIRRKAIEEYEDDSEDESEDK